MSTTTAIWVYSLSLLAAVLLTVAGLSENGLWRPVKSRVTQFTSRVRVLATGRVNWIDMDAQTSEQKLVPEKLDWPTRWALFGVHCYHWRWYQKLFRRRCGCLQNWVTRRVTITNVDCPHHGVSRFWIDDAS